MSNVLLLCLLSLGHLMVDFMIGIWPVFKTMIGIDLGVAGAMLALAAFLGEGSQMAFGNISDKGYKKRLVLVGVGLTCASLGFHLKAPLFLLLLLLMLTSIGSASFHPSAASLLGQANPARRGLYIAIFSTSGALGMASSQIVFTSVHTFFEGHTWLLFAPPLVLVALLFMVHFWRREEASESVSSHGSFEGIKKCLALFRESPFRRLYLMQVCNQTLLWGSVFLLPDVLLTQGHEASIVFGGGHMAFILGGALAMIPVGLIADKYSPKAVMLIAIPLGWAFFTLFLLTPPKNPVLLLGLLALTGAFLGVIQPLAVVLGNQLGSDRPGIASAFTMGMVWCVSEVLGPLGTGFLSGAYPSSTPTSALLYFSVLFPIGFLAASRLPVLSENLIKESL